MPRWLAIVVVLITTVFSIPALGQSQVSFVTVDQGKGEFKGDQQLHIKLGNLVKDGIPKKEKYGAVVDNAIMENPGALIFRMTPYVYVASEMQGAKLDLIGTYKSRNTGNSTYNSYFVVRRDAFPELTGGSSPTLTQVVDWLRDNSRNGKPLRFLFHNRWSTSSYFLPSLYFRSQRIFAVPDREAGGSLTEDSDEPITEILLEDIDNNSSSELVRRVAGGTGTFAAVWDGTRSKFLDQPEGEAVFFVRIPGELPNDLLVSGKSVQKETKSAIEEKLDAGIHLTEPSSDVDTWLHWNSDDARDARAALSVLRRRAMAPPSPTVIDVKGIEVKDDEDKAAHLDKLLDAVRQAVRLSGTELVVKDDYYVRSDIDWTLELIHDDALRLEARYRDFVLDSEVVEQEFRISYLDPEDLTRRIGNLIHNRIHRIRPLWLYQNKKPTVIRDFDFAIPVGEPLPYQVISWEDPESNHYTLQEWAETKAEGADFNKLRLDDDGFKKNIDTTLDFEPMGRTEYRVLLIRPSVERALFRFLSIALVLLFFLAATGAIWDLIRSERRSPKPGRGRQT